MWKWAQGAVASVTGVAEPEYGKEAFVPVDKTVEGRNPFGRLVRDDYNWQQPLQSHVETQTFYFNTPDGYYGLIQLIHSNPVNLAYTSQFTFLLKKIEDPSWRLWTSTRLENGVVDGANFKADGFEITLNDALDEYLFASVVNEDSQVEVRIRRVVDGFKIGEDGMSRYGTDPLNPWGTMRHIFWPRCVMNGRILAQGKLLELKDANSMYVMALQGMKPHHAAARWNFLNFQGPTVSVVVMHFDTPGSYGHGRSSIGAVVKDGKLLATAVEVEIEHQDTQRDEVGWHAPRSIRFTLKGPKIEAPDEEVELEHQVVETTVCGKLECLVDRVDVMAELPLFVKKVASGLSGAHPYIYQYNNELEVTVVVNGEPYTEKGRAFSEATFIS